MNEINATIKAYSCVYCDIESSVQNICNIIYVLYIFLFDSYTPIRNSLKLKTLFRPTYLRHY